MSGTAYVLIMSGLLYVNHKTRKELAKPLRKRNLTRALFDFRLF